MIYLPTYKSALEEDIKSTKSYFLASGLCVVGVVLSAQLNEMVFDCPHAFDPQQYIALTKSLFQDMLRLDMNVDYNTCENALLGPIAFAILSMQSLGAGMVKGFVTRENKRRVLEQIVKEPNPQ